MVQLGHTDFTKFDDFARYAVIVSLTDDCTLELPVSDYSQTLMTKRIPKGFACIFRGDLHHAGSAYANTSYRLYCKAFPDGCHLTEGEDNEVGSGFFCLPTGRTPYGCYRGDFKSEAALKNHRRICPAIRSDASLKAMREKKRIYDAQRNQK